MHFKVFSWLFPIFNHRSSLCNLLGFFFCLFLKALWLPSIREKAVNQHKYIYVFILTFESKYIYDIHFTMAYLTNFFFPYLCLMSIDLCYLTCNHWTGCTINNVLVGMLLPYYAFRNNQADQSGSLAFHSSPALNFSLLPCFQ